MQETITARVRPGCANVLSLGLMCRDHGCTFTWEGWADCPKFFDSRGTEINIWVDHSVAFFDPDPDIMMPALETDDEKGNKGQPLAARLKPYPRGLDH